MCKYPEQEWAQCVQGTGKQGREWQIIRRQEQPGTRAGQAQKGGVRILEAQPKKNSRSGLTRLLIRQYCSGCCTENGEQERKQEHQDRGLALVQVREDGVSWTRIPGKQTLSWRAAGRWSVTESSWDHCQEMGKRQDWAEPKGCSEVQKSPQNWGEGSGHFHPCIDQSLDTAAPGRGGASGDMTFFSGDNL